MDLDLNDEQRSIQETVREFVDRRILPETGEEEARAAVDRVGEAMTTAFAARDEPLAAGFGVAVCPRDGDDPRPLFRAADRAMYAAKPRVPREA